LYVEPGLSIEPLATFYLRQARSYAFVRRVLENSFGEEALGAMRRLTPEGPVPLPLKEGLDLLEALFRGAYLVASSELGLETSAEDVAGRDPAKDRDVLLAWAGSLDTDPDLGRDVRIMVPVFYDLERKKTKVWAILGVAVRPLLVSFESELRVLEVR